MRLILDVHHSRIAAARLRQSGHDVVAAADDPRLAELADEELLRHAAAEGRALVSEDAKDLDRIVRHWAASGEHHAGVVLTSSRRFHRGSAAYPENLIVSLTRLLESPPEPEHDWVHWLQ
ncbi:MAG: DUF5615 family PIN-like protein [Acidimicrobiales bacterium]